MSAIGANGETSTTFHLACSAGDDVDASRAHTICEEFFAAAKTQSGLSVEVGLAVPLAVGPGLEILVDSVGDTHLDLTPTWVNAEGQRLAQPSVGLRAMDIKLTERRRRELYLRLIGDTPK